MAALYFTQPLGQEVLRGELLQRTIFESAGRSLAMALTPLIAVIGDPPALE